MVNGVQGRHAVTVDHHQLIAHRLLEIPVELPEILLQELFCRTVAQGLFQFIEPGQADHAQGVGRFMAVQSAQGFLQHGPIGLAGYPVGFQQAVIIALNAGPEFLFLLHTYVRAQTFLALFQQQFTHTTGQDQGAGGCAQEKGGVGHRIHG